jgi:hypothetical protein
MVRALIDEVDSRQQDNGSREIEILRKNQKHCRRNEE